MKEIGAMNMGELAAFVFSHLKKKGIDVVLSGGACVGILTEGKYVSYDLDFIENFASGRRKLKKVLGEIGFEEEGRYFKHPDTKFFLEFPGGPLAVGNEPPFEISVIHFETGELRMLSATDCIKDRLAAYYHWDDQECLEQALLVGNTREANLAEIERWSLAEGEEKKFKHFKKLLSIKS